MTEQPDPARRLARMNAALDWVLFFGLAALCLSALLWLQLRARHDDGWRDGYEPPEQPAPLPPAFEPEVRDALSRRPAPADPQ